MTGWYALATHIGRRERGVGLSFARTSSDFSVGVYSCAHEGAITDMRISDLKAGWDVVTNDDHRIGTILEVGQHYVKVSGGFFSADIYVPASAIANVENDTVHLHFAESEIDRVGWHQPPRSADELQTTREPDAEREI